MMLRLIHCQPGISQHDLARRLVSSDRAFERCLRYLSGMGLMRIECRASHDGRLLRVLSLTTEGETAKSSLTRIIFARKVAEFEALKTEIEDLEKTVSQAPT